MGLKITPISFSASTLLKSADMNTNWTLTQTATNFDGIWNATTNANVQVSLVDATVSSVNVIRIQPANNTISRSISINGGLSADGAGNCIISNLPNKVISGTSIMYYKNFTFVTGTGFGTYSFPPSPFGIFTQKNTSAVSASMSGWVSNGVDCGSSTQFVILG